MCGWTSPAGFPLFPFVVTTPLRRCSDANMVWEALASVGRMLSLVVGWRGEGERRVLARGADCTNVHVARLIAGLQKAGLNVHDISLPVEVQMFSATKCPLVAVEQTNGNHVFAQSHGRSLRSVASAVGHWSASTVTSLCVMPASNFRGRVIWYQRSHGQPCAWRRCYHDTQRVCVGSTGRRSTQGLENGLRALRRQAVRKTESPKKLEAENKELGARPWRKREEKEPNQGRGLPSRGESGMEEEWEMDMDVEDEIESRKKLDEQKRKLQKELREIDKQLWCLAKEVQESLKSNLQQQLQEMEQRRRNLMPEHQKVQKISQKYKAFRTKEEMCKKKVLQHKRRCGGSERKLVAMRSDFGSCRTKSIRTQWLMQKWQQNSRGCRQEKKKKAATLPKQWIVVRRRWWNNSSL